jgi:hypothetical protein
MDADVTFLHGKKNDAGDVQWSMGKGTRDASGVVSILGK